MHWRAPDLLVALGLLLACTALGVKAAGPGESGERVESGVERSFAARLQTAGVTSIRRHALTRDDSYVVLIVADRQCTGGLALLPLRRNAEGAGLLGDGTRFHFAGKDHLRYPQLRFFVATVRFRLLHRLGLAPGPAPRVLAWRPLEDCARPGALLRQVHLAASGGG